tara:strand:- start:66498 stop:67649 length:1152 start_codon:yes stop_codon:yes gene_type:complete
MSLPRIDTAQVKGQRILVRVDLADPESPFCEYYLTEVATAVEMLLDRGASVVLAGNTGNPEARGALPSLQGLVEPLSKKLDGMKVDFLASPAADLQGLSANSKVALMENLANEPGEIKGDKSFAQSLATNCDAYVNNAFVASRLGYATIKHLPSLLESYAGPTLYQKWDALSSFLSGKNRPAGLILGGLDVAGKTELFKKMMPFLDAFVAGGVVANTMLKARAVQVAESIVDNGMEVEAFQVLQKADLEEIEALIPVDHIIADQVSRKAKVKSLSQHSVTDGFMSVDIGSRTLSSYEKLLKGMNSILWYGPLGVVEIDKFCQGTKAMLKALSKFKGSLILAGEDTCTQALASGKEFRFLIPDGKTLRDFVMQGSLPGIDALKS